MDDLSGLAFLPEQLGQLSKQMEAMKTQVAELRAADLRKATGAEVRELREELASLTASVERARQADAPRFERFEARLRALSSAARSKPSTPRSPQPSEGELLRASVYKLETKFAEALGQKADATAVSHLSEQVRTLGDSIASQRQAVTGSEEKITEKVEKAAREAQAAADANRCLAERLRVTQQSLESSLLQFREVQASQAQGPVVVCEQLNTQYRSLTTSMSQKADWSEVEQLRVQLRALSGNVTLQVEAAKSHTADAEQLSKLARVSDKAQAEVDKLRGELKDLSASCAEKADAARVEDVVQQLSAMSDIVSQKLGNPTRRLRRPHPPFSASCPTGHGGL